MSRLGGMVTGVLRWRRVATAHVAATRAPAQVEPPATGGQAFDTARATWLDCDRWSFSTAMCDHSSLCEGSGSLTSGAADRRRA